LLEGNIQIGDQAAAKFPDVAITIVTVQEIFNGWTSRINDPSKAQQLVWLYPIKPSSNRAVS
jgi:tRNA(fMet)-specific endonuclease VapC